MRCPGCSCSFEQLVSACPQCGAVLEFSCDECGRRSATDSAFCAGCGNRLATLVLAESESTAPADASEPAEGGHRLDGQRRIVTIVMSDLSGYTAMGERLDPEDVAQIMGTIKRDGTEIIESFGGIVNQFIGDEIVSLFGLPSVRDDDARRAVSAALALHERVDALNREFPQPLTVPLTMHSGIHAGLLIAEFRDSRSGVYELTGDAINTAARLLSVAGRGEVVIGAPTLEAVEPFFEIEDAGSHQVRGKADPLQAYRVLKPRAHVSRFDAARERGLTPLAGRDEQLTRLDEVLDLVADADGQIVVVEAEAGTGKSRLCFEFLQRQHERNRDFALVKGRCQAYGSMTSYLPFIQVVRETLGIALNDAVEVVLDTVGRAVHDLDPELDRFVPAYLHLLSSISVDELPTEWRGEALPDILQEAIVVLVLASARRTPTVVQLDDWHWADEASTATLLRLRRAVAATRTMVIVTQRPGSELHTEAIAAEKLTLGPLPRAATEHMIAGYFGTEAVQPQLAAKIYERTLGNPFFVEEVCRALQGQGQARVVGDQLLPIGDVEGLLIPETVQAVVLARVDALEPDLRAVLRAASVIGREFSGDVLSQLSDVESLPALLDQLDHLGFIEGMADADRTRFRFRHIIAQEVTYEALLVRERKAAHARIATVIENSQSPADIQQRRKVEALAYHFQRAGHSAKALDYLELAGEKAAARRALAEARHQIHAAIDETFKLDQTKELRARRGQLTLEWAAACIFLPSVSQLDLLASVRDEALEDQNFEVALLTTFWINWIHYSVGNQLTSEAGSRSLLAQVESAGQASTAGLVQCHLGQVLVIQRRHDEAEAVLFEGLGRRKSPTDGARDGGGEASGLYCYSLAQQTLIDGDRGEFSRNTRPVDAALVLVRRGGERSTESSLLIVSAIARTFEGDWVGVREDIEAISRLPDPSVSPFVEVMATVLHGYATFRLGAEDEGLRALRRGVATHEQSEGQLVLCLNRALLADALARRGQDEEATAMARAALARREVGDLLGEDIAACVLLQTEGLSGSMLASKVAELRSATKTGCPREVAMLDLAAAKAHLRAGEIDAATSCADAAITATSALGMTAYCHEAQLLRQHLDNDRPRQAKEDR